MTKRWGTLKNFELVYFWC